MTEYFKYKEEGEVGYLIFDYPSEKINKISPDVLDDLEQKLDALSSKPIKALAITSAKEDIFIAGADIKIFEKAFENPAIAEKLIDRGHAVFRKLASLPIPTVAAINGVCLGGGTELALACKFRVASDSPKVQIGTPEVNLGIFPGWGGTQRLPRLVGLEEGTNLILTGKSVDAKKAFKLKLVDAVLPKEFFKEELQKFMISIESKEKQKELIDKRKKGGLKKLLLEDNPMGRSLFFYMANKKLQETTKGHYKAPELALDVIKRTYALPLDEGLKEEVAVFKKGLQKDFSNSKNLINLFFASEEVKKNPGMDLPKDVPKINRAAVIGAGTMGAKIAYLLTSKDIPVRLKDLNWNLLGKGYGTVFEIYQILVKKRKFTKEQADRKFQLLSATKDYSGFKQADLVIEAAVENLEIKNKIFSELEAILSEEAIIATNTSSLVIDSMAKTLKHPERFIGMHFFNPPDRMPLVEIIPGSKTSKETIARVVNLCKTLGKTAVVVKDVPGFLVNRVFATAANEASWLLEEGIDMETLDKKMTSFGMPMGPFVLADEVGNDIVYKVFNVIENAYGERMKQPEIMKLMVENQYLGKKNGKGFYLWKGERKGEKNPGIKRLLSKTQKPKTALDPREAEERILFSMINEASRCLGESVAASPTYIDLALVYGTGFPPFRGGLLRYADERGIPYIVERLKVFEKKYGSRFAPSQVLLEKASKKEKFYS